MKSPIDQITCSFCLLQSLNVLTSHGIHEHFLADWNRTFNKRINYFFLLELQVEDIEVFATHIVANDWDTFNVVMSDGMVMSL